MRDRAASAARVLLTAGIAASTGFMALTGPPAIATAMAQMPSAGIVDLSITFTVVNQNRSRVPCSSDGARYTVRGHIIAPNSVLNAPAPRAITVYLHNLGWSSYYWHFTDVSGYDYATEMASLGHASLVYDLLGYGQSDHPVGTGVCYGSQADIAHQIVGALRSGSYSATPPGPASFQRIALASATDEALTAQPEAYSFADIDALIITSWADWFPTTTLLTQQEQIAMFCGSGGEPQGGADGPPGYAYVPLKADDFRTDYFANADPAVVQKATAMRTRSPCGELNSATTVIAEDEVLLPTIAVPVLLVYGNEDALWSQPSSGQANRNHFLGSRSVTAEFLPNTGQALALERTTAKFRHTISQWLCSNFEPCTSEHTQSGGGVPLTTAGAMDIPNTSGADGAGAPWASVLSVCALALAARWRRRYPGRSRSVATSFSGPD